MAGFKVLHAADLHLDGPVSAPDADMFSLAQRARRESLGRLVDLAKQHEAKLVLLPGDIFDTPNPPVSAGLAFSQACHAFCQMGAKVFITPGNHDPWQDGSFWRYWIPPEGVTVFSPEPRGVALDELGVWVAGAAFGRVHVQDDLAAGLPRPLRGLIGLACQHCDPGSSGAESDGLFYAPANIQTMTEMGFSYWALGHLHKPQVLSQNPLIVMAGSPQGAHLAEDGPHGAHILEIDHGAVQHEFAPLSLFNYYNLRLSDLGQAESALSLAGEVSAELEKAGRAPGHPACLRLSLAGPSPLWRDMMGESGDELRQELKSALDLDGLILLTDELEAPLDLDGLLKRQDVLGHFLHLTQRCEQDPAYLAKAAKELKGLHPAGASKDPAEKAEYLQGLLGQVRKLALKDLWLGGEE
jgi:exonuclease SbcD